MLAPPGHPQGRAEGRQPRLQAIKGSFWEVFWFQQEQQHWGGVEGAQTWHTKPRGTEEGVN